MTRKNKQSSAARRLHRSFGAIAAVFIFFLVVSGLMINHSNSLGLDRNLVSQAMVLKWYGLERPEDVTSFAVGNHWLSFAGSQLYLNGEQVASIPNGVGVTSNGDILVAAGGDELLLLSSDGQLIERQAWDSAANGPLESIGAMPGGLVVLQAGGRLWQSDTDLLSWHVTEIDLQSPAWSSPQDTPDNLLQSISRHYQGEGISLERLLLDLHSGRIFGTVGVLIYDLIALTVGFLAISGLFLWARGRRNGNRNGNGNGKS
jgi:hypothetical protein